MNNLNNHGKWSTIEGVPFVISALGDKIRLIVGFGINVVGAAIVLVYGIRLLGF